MYPTPRKESTDAFQLRQNPVQDGEKSWTAVLWKAVRRPGRLDGVGRRTGLIIVISTAGVVADPVNVLRQQDEEQADHHHLPHCFCWIIQLRSWIC